MDSKLANMNREKVFQKPDTNPAKSPESYRIPDRRHSFLFLPIN